MSDIPGIIFGLINMGNVELTLHDHTLEGAHMDNGTAFRQHLAPMSVDGSAAVVPPNNAYHGSFTYTPDGGATLLTYSFGSEGGREITITTSKTGPSADRWALEYTTARDSETIYGARCTFR